MSDPDAKAREIVSGIDRAMFDRFELAQTIASALRSARAEALVDAATVARFAPVYGNREIATRILALKDKPD